MNEQPVQGIVTLRPGDTVRFGNTVWRLGGERGRTVAAATPAAAAPRGARAARARGRGDRPPTGIRQAIGSEPVYGEALPAVRPVARAQPGARPLGRRAALEVTLYSYTVVIATAAAVVIYFIQR